jgi:pyruvate/2-oxoglutarate dehydrogenase complex dihydrolipoamide dehydrogenase (E3) component
LAIVGGGPMGCEMAQAHARLGVRVVLLERDARLLPGGDSDASAAVEAALRVDGVDVRVGARITAVREVPAGVSLEVGDGQLVCDELLVAAGRAPCLDELDPGAGGVGLTDRGWIDVDECLRTSSPGVYAAGDVVGSVQLTHAAVAMAALAVDNALRAGAARVRPQRFDPVSVPSVTFTSPEVGQVGITEARATRLRGARVAELPMGHVDRARAADRTEGFVKLIAVPRRIVGNLGGGRLLGATVVGERAGELASELALAHRTGMFVGRLAQVVHPYPTWSTAISQAATQFFTDAFTGMSARPPRDEGAAR